MKIYTDENDIPKRGYFDNCECKMLRDNPSEWCGAIQKPVWATYTGSTLRWGKLLWVYKTDEPITCPKCGNVADYIYVWDPKDEPSISEYRSDGLELIKVLEKALDRIGEK